VPFLPLFLPDGVVGVCGLAAAVLGVPGLSPPTVIAGFGVFSSSTTSSSSSLLGLPIPDVAGVAVEAAGESEAEERSSRWTRSRFSSHQARSLAAWVATSAARSRSFSLRSISFALWKMVAPQSCLKALASMTTSRSSCERGIRISASGIYVVVLKSHLLDFLLSSSESSPQVIPNTTPLEELR